MAELAVYAALNGVNLKTMPNPERRYREMLIFAKTNKGRHEVQNPKHGKRPLVLTIGTG